VYETTDQFNKRDETVAIQHGDLVRIDRGWWVMCHNSLLDGLCDTTDFLSFAIDRQVTDSLDDALAFYAAPLARLLAERADYVRIEMRPTAACLRRLLDGTDADWALCSRWWSLYLTYRENGWSLIRVEFGNGANYRTHLQNNRLRPAVDAYRATMRTAAVAFVICDPGVGVDFTNPELIRNLSQVVQAALETYGWTIISKASSGIAFYVTGPVGALRHDAFVSVVKNVWKKIDAVHELSLGFATSDKPAIVRNKCRHFTQYVNFLEPFPIRFRNWSDPVYQWFSVHNQVLNTTLALLPLELSHFVLLWIVQWIPWAYHSDDLSVLRLIQSITNSARRVISARKIRQ
jgi:hypothetical protein